MCSHSPSITFVYLCSLGRGRLADVRWGRLFDDLGGQMEAAERADRDAEAADLRRLEESRVALVDRLAAAAGCELTLSVEGIAAMTGTVEVAGADFVLLRTRSGTEMLVPLTGVTSVTGLPVGSAPPDPLDRRLGLGAALRRLARDRQPVTLSLRDGQSLSGTIDRVGLDALDIAEHAPDEPRRSGEV